jgi:hypothetical protein
VRARAAGHSCAGCGRARTRFTAATMRLLWKMQYGRFSSHLQGGEGGAVSRRVAAAVRGACVRGACVRGACVRGAGWQGGVHTFAHACT